MTDDKISIKEVDIQPVFVTDTTMEQISSHKGRFEIAHHLLFTGDSGRLAQLFNGIIILDCRWCGQNDSIEYIAAGPMFAEVSPGMAAPMYTAKITQDADGDLVSIEWVQIKEIDRYTHPDQHWSNQLKNNPTKLQNLKQEK